MNEAVKTPWHIWVIGGIALLWNGIGVMAFLATVTGSIDPANYPPEQIEFFNNTPLWANAFWAVGVFFALFGSLALLLRHRTAVLLFGISIIGLIGSTAYQRLSGDLPEMMQTTGQNLFALAIWAITLFLFIYANRMRGAGVLK